MLEQILEVLSTALVAVLVAIIPILGAKAISFISEKIKGVQVKTGVDKYNAELAVAFNVWRVVDEAFRITPTITATIDAKVNMFEDEILKKIPYLNKDDIDHLRQTVAGVINQAKDVITAPAKEVVTVIPVTPVVDVPVVITDK